MNGLAPGERLVRCLTGVPIDRAPFGVGLGWQPWGDALANWQRDSGIGTLDPAECFGYDLGFAIPELHSGIWPPFETTLLCEDDETYTARDGRGITLRNRRDGASMPEWLDYPVHTPDEWRSLKHERLQIGDPTRIAEDLNAFARRVRASGEAVQVGAYPWGVFGSVRDLLGVEALLVALYDEPEMVADMMQHLTSLWLHLWEAVAQVVQIDHIHIWEDMSGKQGSLISPHMIERFMMPQYARIAGFARAHGVHVISVDSDGDCSELVPLMMRYGVNAFMPFEVQAGNDVRVYRAQYPSLGIYGGLDKRALSANEAAVDAEIARADEMLKGGRYIAAFDHLIPPDAEWKLFKRAAEGIKACIYRGVS